MTKEDIINKITQTSTSGKTFNEEFAKHIWVAKNYSIYNLLCDLQDLKN